MMATEATIGGPVDVSVNEPSPNQPTSTDPDFQDENTDRLSIVVNGSADDIDNKQITDIVDELVNSAEASVSGGSDTEASKADPTKSAGEKGHVRSSSAVKKPQSFKSVSVNRTFLASKSATGSTSRPESAAGSVSTTPQPTASSSASRLKLVAKSGSNLGGASKTLGVNGKPSGAPDPNTVWNRNRAPAQPEAKKRSDEELKHDGIHLADRLGPEDLKGQSNWADIDDDDEWAPETITWTDGTKITLPSAEEPVASPVPQPAIVEKVKKEPVLVPKPKSPAPMLAPVSSASGSPSIKHSVLASGKGLVLKGAPEKPTLVAKPPAPPGPVKSPWAALPPVEKVPPGVVDLASQAPASRYSLRDTSNSKSTTPPPPAKEIAADDFSRNYRDGNSSRELYNSHSGRYEPVSDRRGSRSDIHARQPALLQRQAHNDQQGPAEPSAAFQTSRSSIQEGPYGRRRGSSNVSGGSGHLAHRIGGKPHDMPPPPELSINQGHALQHRAGSVPGSAESHVSSQAFSTNNQSDQRTLPPQPYQPLVSPHQPHAVPYQNTYNQELPQTGPDWEKTQKEYMKKRGEEAVRRRLEEEAREEEARKVRIAEKLKALGPAPERKSTKKDLVSVVQRTEIPTALASRPDASSDTKMATDPVPTASSSSEAKAEKSAASDSASKEFAKHELRVTNGSIKPPTDYEQPRIPSGQSAPGQPAASWSDSSQQPDRFQPWTANHQNASRNVWAAPGNDRSLGNGTFNADIGPRSEAHAATGANMIHRPAPIAPPRSAPHAPQTETQSNRLPPIGPPRGPPNPVNAWKTYDIKADDERRRLDRAKQRETLPEKTSGPTFTDTWRSVDLNGEGKRSTVGTYVQSHREPSTELPETDKGTPHPEGGRQAAAPLATAAPPTGASTQARTSSRFFPASKDIQQHEASTQPSSRSKSPTPPPPTADGHPVYDGDATKPHVALPPQRPRVRLPPSAQPAAPGPIAPPPKQPAPSFAAAAASASNAPQKIQDANATGRPVSRGRGFNGIPQKPHEIASQENWQSKINNLMGKKSTSPVKFSSAGSSMIGQLESSQSHDSMDIPILSPSGTDSTVDSSFTSKEMAEECFGEQEMGSLPAVRLPTEAPDAAWQAVQPNWFPTPTGFRVNPTSCEPFKFGLDYDHGKSVIRISTPGMLDAKNVYAPMLGHRSGSNPRRAGPRAGGPRHPPRANRRGGRDSSEHMGDHSTASSSSRAASSRGTRNFRSRGETWSRHIPSTSTTQS
ncbi:putative ATP synthase subunit mitochondrial protein [Rosellinia necatrix]|uniref:Putative ATP synthase subunit mitochondrial protein n=1 Tax=Rosellinia necatrix TaxID=77044 RepID=A0A1W2TD48_ROSNE|nr:putative ATP synthase subunit mitochondrial protein [Rosellinia necatrix]